MTWKKIGLNLMYYDDFNITYILDTIPNTPAGPQLPYQSNNDVWIVEINGEEPVNAKVSNIINTIRESTI